jgi:hypothetical protein
MVVFPAPEQPVIWTAVIGVYRRLAAMPVANEFVVPRREQVADDERDQAGAV